MPGYWDSDGKVKCRCGWSGTRGQGIVEYFGELETVHCPKCDSSLGVVPYPTPEETRAAAEAGNEMAKVQQAADEERAAFLERASKAELKSPDQLPEIEGDSLVIDWDFEETDDAKWTVLRHEGNEIAREMAYFEGIDRYEAVFELLLRKYGTRLIGFRPTRASAYYLFGDDLRSPGIVTRIDEELRQMKR